MKCVGDLLIQVVETEGAIPLLKLLVESDLKGVDNSEMRSLLDWLARQGIVNVKRGIYSLTELGYHLSVLIEDFRDWGAD